MSDFGKHRYEFPSFVRKPVDAHYTESKRNTSCDKLRIAEDALKYALFNLDAWVYGGRFAITESDVDTIGKIKEALKLIAEEGGEK